MMKYILFFFLLLELNKVVRSQGIDSVAFSIPRFRTVVIHSKILHEDRKIYIYRPDENTGAGNLFETDHQFPVLYILDAETHMAVLSAEAKFLAASQNLKPMIIVGIGTINYDRTKNLTPTNVSNGGGAEDFLRFLSEELMPYIHAHCPTLPFSILCGHSIGGLFSGYCLVNHPQMFNAYMAISPSFWWDQEYAVKLMADKIADSIYRDKQFFFSDAEEGGRLHTAALRFDSILQQKNFFKFDYKYVHYAGETHTSEVPKSFHDGIRYIFKQFDIPSNDTTALQIQQYYRRLSAKYGYTILPPEYGVNDLAYSVMFGKGQTDAAIALFTLNTINHPNSFNAFDSLGDAYNHKGNKKEAIACYKRAIDLNHLDSDPNNTKQKLKELLGKNLP